MDSIKADHGFNMDSKSVKNLLQAMTELSPTLRREFLQFVTGSPKLPIGGKCSIAARPSKTHHVLIYIPGRRLPEPHANVHGRLQAERTALHLR